MKFRSPIRPEGVDPVSAAFGRVTAKTAQRQMQLAVKVNYLSVPGQFSFDASLFKAFRITESTSIRLNLDAFNAFNNPSLVRPDMSTGILTLRDSGVGARQLQATLRLNW